MSIENAMSELAAALVKAAEINLQSAKINGLAMETLAGAYDRQLDDARKPADTIEQDVAKVEQTAKVDQKAAAAKELAEADARMKADKAAAAAKKAAEEKAAAEAEKIADPETSLDYEKDVRPLLIAFGKRDKTGLVKLLGELGVSKGQDLKPEQYQAAINGAQEVQV